MEQLISMETFQLFLTFFTTVLASSGFWLFMSKRNETKDTRYRLLKGLAHDRILYLGMKYVERGWITKDEYENLYEYLYKPYSELDGNGSACRIMAEVNKLPIRESKTISEEKE